MTHLVTICGTGEVAGTPTNMLNLVAAMADRPFTHTDLDYPASVTISNPNGDLAGASELESRAVGLANLKALLETSPEPVILMGYSLGALVVSDYLEQRAAGLPGPNIVAVINIANPSRWEHDSYGLPSVGYGLDGQHGPWPMVPRYEIANPADMITSASKWSPWRRFAVVIRGLSFGNLGAWVPALLAGLDELKAQGLGSNWWKPEWWVAFAQAPGELWGYLYGGEHTTAYTDRAQWADEEGNLVTGAALAALLIDTYA